MSEKTKYALPVPTGVLLTSPFLSLLPLRSSPFVPSLLPLPSSPFVLSPTSHPFPSPQLISWYDNEYGYSHRVVDLIAYIGKKL